MKIASLLGGFSLTQADHLRRAMSKKKQSVMVQMRKDFVAGCYRVNKINDEGGINGHPLEVIIYDDETDETKGVIAVNKLINEDKVLAVMGTTATGVSYAMAPICIENEIMLVTVASDIGLAAMGPWVFKPSPGQELLVEAIWITMRDWGITKLALLSSSGGFGKGGRAYIMDHIEEEGFELVAAEEYGPTDTDMTPQLTNIKGTDAELLYIYGAEPAGAIAAGQAKQIGIEIPVDVSGGISNVASIALSGGFTADSDDIIDINSDLTTTAGAITVSNADQVQIDASAARNLSSAGAVTMTGNVDGILLDGGSNTVSAPRK